MTPIAIPSKLISIESTIKNRCKALTKTTRKDNKTCDIKYCTHFTVKNCKSTEI